MKKKPRPLLRWVTRYPVLALVVLLLLAIVLLNGLGGLGLPALFWGTENVWYELATGITIAIFFAVCSLVGFLLDWGDEPATEDELRATMRWYFTWTFLPLTILVAVWWIVRIVRWDIEPYRREWGLPLGCIIGAALLWFGSRVFHKPATKLAATRWFPASLNAIARKFRGAAIPDPNIWYHAYAATVTATLFVLYVIAAWFFVDSPHLPAAVAIIILLLLIVLPYGVVRFLLPRASVVVVLGLAGLAFLTNLVPFKHRLENVGDYSAPVPIDQKPTPKPPLLPAKVLESWVGSVKSFDERARCTPMSKPRAVVMMTSGGGIRAAVWTAVVLRELDRLYCGFSYHTKLIAGASGGMVGAAYYLAHELPAPGESRVTSELPEIAKDSLAPVARSLALRDVPWFFLPFPFDDRGRALEKAWSGHVEAMGERFTSLAPGEAAGWRPSLVFSPMLVEDGRQLLISNLELDEIVQRPARRLDIGEQIYSRPSVQFFHLYPDSKVSIATVARMSASFPWVSPASELPSEPYRRVVDAGYFDNFGGYVTAAWLRRYLPYLRANTSGVLVVQIRDDESDDANRAVASAEAELPERAFSELVAPLSAIFKTRNPAKNYHNDFDLSAFTSEDGFVSSVVIELPKETAPLSWNLTARETKHIAAAVRSGQAGKAIASISAWWTAPPVPRPATRTAPIP